MSVSVRRSVCERSKMSSEREARLKSPTPEPRDFDGV
jgi:hypothetical protein